MNLKSFNKVSDVFSWWNTIKTKFMSNSISFISWARILLNQMILVLCLGFLYISPHFQRNRFIRSKNIPWIFVMTQRHMHRKPIIFQSSNTHKISLSFWNWFIRYFNKWECFLNAPPSSQIFKMLSQTMVSRAKWLRLLIRKNEVIFPNQ